MKINERFLYPVHIETFFLARIVANILFQIYSRTKKNQGFVAIIQYCVSHPILRKAKKISTIDRIGFLINNCLTMTGENVEALLLINMAMILCVLAARHHSHQVETKIGKARGAS